MAQVKLELIDLGNREGSPVLSWAYCEGGVQNNYSSRQMDVRFRLKHANPNTEGSVPIVVRGVSPSLDAVSKYTDTVINIEWHGKSGEFITGRNDNWQDLPEQALIDSLNLEPDDTNESLFFDTVYGGLHLVTLTGDANLGDNQVKRARIDIIRGYETGIQEPDWSVSGQETAWIKYDTSSGMNGSRVFGYNVKMVYRISGETAQDDIDYYRPSELLFWSGYSYTGACVDVDLMLDATGITCDNGAVEGVDGNPTLEVCLPTGLSSGALQDAVNRVIRDVFTQESSKGSFAGDLLDDSAITNDLTNLSYVTYEGMILFNSPYDGDSITLEAYDFDYSGTYSGIFNSAPPYPPPSITLNYPGDYDSIESLTAALNAELSGGNFNLWNNANCLNSSSLSGFFESGGLLTATQSGDNAIILKSLRAGAMGRYRWTFGEADRPLTGITKRNIRNFLLPDVMLFEGSQDNSSWSALDTNVGIDWASLEPTKYLSIDGAALTGLPSGEEGVSSLIVGTGLPTRKMLYEIAVSGNDKCGSPFNMPIEFYELPSGVTCGEESMTRWSGVESSEPFISGSGDSLVYELLVTGRKFFNTGEFNYYRLTLSGLNASNQGTNIQVDDYFIVNTLTLFGFETGSQVLSGEMCLLGANYSGKIQGYATGLLEGSITGTANESGKFCVNKQVLTGLVGEAYLQDRLVTPVGGFTGLLTACATGTGFYTANVVGNFYDEDNSCLYFYAPVSGTITGVGEMVSDTIAILNDGVVASLTGSYYETVSGWEFGVLTGTIPNFRAFYTNIECFFEVSGNITGVTTSGSLGSYTFNEDITYIPTGTVYAVEPSGGISAFVQMAYVSPVTGDWIEVDGVRLIYQTGSGYAAPSYFNSLTGLTSIFNENEHLGASASDGGGNLYLTSLSSGDDSNVAVSSSRVGAFSFSSPTFTGGEFIYSPMSAINAFTGNVTGTLTSTGYYTASGSGILTGVIKLLDFVREFSGIWGLSTGEVDFRESGWITGGNQYQNSGFQTIPEYSGRPSIIPLTVSYRNDPLVYSYDTALLTISGVGTNSGVSLVVSGSF